MTIQRQSIPISIAMDDQNYAWELLESEIHIKTTNYLTGLQVSTLLSLYMKGVERLNSLADKREIYFQNKITQLMGNPDVIKLLTETQSHENKTKGILKLNLNLQETIEKKKNFQQNITKQLINDALIYTQVITKHELKVNSIQEKVNQIVKHSSDKIQSRIMQRKIKSLSSRSNHDSMYQQVVESFKGKLNNMADSKSNTNQNLNLSNRNRAFSSKNLQTNSNKRRNTCHTYEQDT